MRFFKNPQNDYFAQSCKKRFEWQIENPFIAEAERDVLRCLTIEPGSAVLELGSGTGSNLNNLRQWNTSFSFTGIDINEAETHRAKAYFSDACFFVGDATNVALPDESFDLVFCRDLLHHVDVAKQKTVIEEMTRMTRPGGQVVVIESNGRNVVIKAFGRLVQSERGVLQSVPERIEALFRRVLCLELVAPVPQYVEPNNLFRLLLHYHLGFPRLAQCALVRSALRCFNRFAARLVPPERWAYMVFCAVKKD